MKKTMPNWKLSQRWSMATEAGAAVRNISLPERKEERIKPKGKT